MEIRYCSYCWTRLPEGAAECPDCGASIAEMEATWAAREAQDRRWKPPGVSRATRRAGSPRRTAASERARRRASPRGGALALQSWPLPMPPPLRREWLRAAGAGGAAGALCVAAAWFLIFHVQAFPATSGPPPSSPPARPAAAQPVPLPPARVEWALPDSEFRMRLLTRDGRIVARSVEGPAQVPPGRYRLRVSDSAGRWRGPERLRELRPGERARVAPEPEVAAAYLVWRGRRLHADGRARAAERAWRRALALDPKQVEARLQLAAAEAVRFRYAAARALLREVERLDPGNRRARRLSRVLDALEPTR